MNKFSSIFGQILQIFPKVEFYKAVLETGSERGAKGFTCWEQFASMLFCQIGHAHSLREICGGLASVFGKIKHLGIYASPKRSTLSYANKHRPWQLYEKIFYQMLGRCQTLAAGRKKFRFKNRLLSLDATMIPLCASLFDWAKYKQTKGAVKLHLLLDHEGYLPVFASVTEGTAREFSVARGLSFPAGSILAVDRGYIDYALFRKWTDEKVYFVTRERTGANFKVVEDRSVPGERNILKDQMIELVEYASRKKYPYLLRRIEVWDKEQERVIVLITNHHEFGATTISSIYKDRWQIEIFFKTIKQNLRIKTFVGTSSNALMIQIWTALIAILVLKYLKFRSSFGWSLSNLVAMLRYNLFAYRDLWIWIDNPFEPSPIAVEAEQLSMGFV